MATQIVGGPRFWEGERDSSGNRQVLLGPNAPDDVYRIEYTYRKQTTDGTYSLDESRWPLVLALALLIGKLIWESLT